MSDLQNTDDDDRAKRTCLKQWRISGCIDGADQECPWVAMYAMEDVVTEVMPWMQALPDRVALTSFSTELGEVNTCLNALSH